LLPAPFVDTEERGAFIATMRQMDREGRRIWRRFFDFRDAQGAAALEERTH
jgi:hypothetical protein